jgi:hypothetical protein
VCACVRACVCLLVCLLVCLWVGVWICVEGGGRDRGFVKRISLTLRHNNNNNNKQRLWSRKEMTSHIEREQPLPASPPQPRGDPHGMTGPLGASRTRQTPPQGSRTSYPRSHRRGFPLLRQSTMQSRGMLCTTGGCLIKGGGLLSSWCTDRRTTAKGGEIGQWHSPVWSLGGWYRAGW